MKTTKIEHPGKVPRGDTPSKIAKEVQPKNKSKGVFLFNSYAQWNCCIRGVLFCRASGRASISMCFNSCE